MSAFFASSAAKSDGSAGPINCPKLSNASISEKYKYKY